MDTLKKHEGEFQEVKYVGAETKHDHELKPDDGSNQTNTLYLYLTVLMIQIPILLSGAHIVWNSPAIPKITSNDSHINPLEQPATTVDISMIAGVPVLAGLIGTLALPKFSDILGRKLFLQGMVLFIFLGSLLLTFSRSVTVIIVSKCIISIFLHGATAIVPIYVTEICEDHNRAKFGCFLGLFHQIGHFYTFIVGPLFSYKIFNFLISIPAIPFLALFIFFPESPAYLIYKGKRTQCDKALKKLRHNKSNKEIEEDIRKLEETVTSKQNVKKNASIISLFKTKETRVGLMLAMLPLTVVHLSGVSVIMSFLAPFFNSAGTGMSGHKVGVIVSIAKMICFAITSSVVERVGRKRMLFLSSLATGVPLFGLGCYFYLKHINHPIIHQLQWLPLILVLSNVTLYSLGLGPIPISIVHEMFTAENRAAAGSFLMTVTGILIFLLTSSYPIIAATIGTHWAVWLFSFSCFVGSFLIYKYLPETNGKSLLQIQEMLKNY
ncbi:facilitated trehalose transporter Tret1-like [Diabrotica undecimpunctata]|uniref:facilitated trehalose transporter Tret1-like n=1 Tax=Diabrotica undecimpunctata TaxID=50387 RepID=UPI003B63907D